MNAGIERFSADPTGVGALQSDADHSGLIDLPIIALHAVGDPIVSIEGLYAYRDLVAQVGRSHLFLPIATSEAEHSRLSEVQYVAGLLALEAWVGSGVKPTFSAVLEVCDRLSADFAEGCRMVPNDTIGAAPTN